VMTSAEIGCEIAAGNQHYSEWLNYNLYTNIPHKIPMGENLKIAWTPTDRCSTEPLRVTLTDEFELQVHWQEYRWVSELELLGQVYLNKHLVYLTERFCMQNDDANKPHALYRRDGQKSICVTNLVAALEDPTTSKLSLLQTDDTTYDINFQKGDLTCKFRIDVHSLEAQIYTSDSNQFPEFAENAYIEELIDEPTDAELADRAAGAVDPSQTQAAFTVSFAKHGDDYGEPRKLKAEDPQIAKWNSSGRIPPFDASGKARVDHANKFIKAPFRDTRPVTNPMVSIRKGANA